MALFSFLFDEILPRINMWQGGSKSVSTCGVSLDLGYSTDATERRFWTVRQARHTEDVGEVSEAMQSVNMPAVPAT